MELKSRVNKSVNLKRILSNTNNWLAVGVSLVLVWGRLPQADVIRYSLNSCEKFRRISDDVSSPLTFKMAIISSGRKSEITAAVDERYQTITEESCLWKWFDLHHPVGREPGVVCLCCGHYNYIIGLSCLQLSLLLTSPGHQQFWPEHPQYQWFIMRVRLFTWLLLSWLKIFQTMYGIKSNHIENISDKVLN